MNWKRIDLTGKKFNRLLVLGFSHLNNYGVLYWHVKCDCGNKRAVRGSSLKNGHTKSCSCFHKEITSKTFKKHGRCGESIYGIWNSMKQRCLNINDSAYKYYGGRGINVCERWMKFENFIKDMGERPEDLTLERKNNNGDYTPRNCKWATRKEQNNNNRSNRILKYNGLSLTIAQWADKLKIKPNTLNNRVFREWSTERSLAQKIEKRNYSV
ncbi:hypothetical protein LCGC14_1157150 [marine sediment metagenome]|uniref:Uncharacterized protein n=1 Tax=marine sediment metagenome TaxID=412755 RepID=A0A0F9PC13_9ZZZZ